MPCPAPLPREKPWPFAMPCPAPLPLEIGDSPSPRPGTEIPGYTGFVPRKGADNVYGATFHAANDCAAVSDSRMYDDLASPTRSLSPAARRLLDTEGGAGAYSPTDAKARFFQLGGRRERSPIGPDTQAAAWAASLRSGEEDANAATVKSEWRYLRSPSLESPISQRESARSDRCAMSPERQIAGYAGYMPKVGPENIYGLNYQAANEQAFTDRPADEGVTLRLGSPTSTRRELSKVPGYTGFIPGVAAENLYSLSFQNANEVATCKKDTRAKKEMEKSDATLIGPDNTKAASAKSGPEGKATSGDSAKADETADTAIRGALAARSPKANKRSMSARSSSRGREIPGYSGYVPRKGPCNIVGKSFKRANDEAETGPVPQTLTEFWANSLRSEAPDSPQNSRSLSPGREIPGYSGYVPRKGPQNIYGSGFQRANEDAAAAMSAKEKLAGARTRKQSRDVVNRETLSTPREQAFGADAVSESWAETLRSGSSTPTSRRIDTTRSLSPGRNMPGYGGYIPRKAARNVYGTGLTTANERAAADAQSDDVPVTPQKLTYDTLPVFSPVQDEGDRNATEERPPLGRESTGEIPSFIDHVPKKNRRGEVMEAARRPFPPDPWTRSRSSSPMRDRSIPGYAGYVPKVSAENMFGMRHAMASSRGERGVSGERAIGSDFDAASERRPPSVQSGSRGSNRSENGRLYQAGLAEPRNDGKRYEAASDGVPESLRSGSSWQDSRAMSPGSRIPGYCGYIPRKGPCNVIGATFAEANERAAAGFDPVKTAETEATLLLGSVY